MKFVSRVEIDAPAQAVFNELSDFGAIDRLARKRAISLKRVDTMSHPGVGMQWQSQFQFRGRPRDIDLTMTQFTPPDALEYTGQTQGFEIVCLLQIVSLARNRSRLIVTVEVKPKSLGARLLVQSARLGKSGLDRRFDDRVRRFGSKLDDRLTRAAREG